jgi:hypothetical protein
MGPLLTTAGLDLILQWLLGISLPEPLVVVLFTDPPAPSEATLFADFTVSALPGASPVPLVSANWTDMTSPGLGDYTYPVIPYVFGATAGGETLIGFFVYTAVSDTVLWFDVFEFPQIIPPSGGQMFLNLEIRDLTRV